MRLRHAEIHRHDTRFYWAASVNWRQNYENLRNQVHAGTGDAETVHAVGTLQDWIRSQNLDLQHNIIDALGSEVSIQSEWGDQTTFPEIGLFVKLDHPDDFKPVIAAFIDSVRKACATTAVIQQISLPNQNFATLNFVPAGQITPTITEDGPYLGVFLTANQAVRSYQRDPTINLLHNPDFIRQIGDRRNGAHQIVFLDSPYILNRGYKLAAPYLAIASLFNKDLASMLQNNPLPDDMKWLAPIGTWSCVVSTDETGVQAYSVSGVGNQGVLWSGLTFNGVQLAQHMGALPTLDTLLHSLEPPAPPVATSLGELPPATAAATPAPAPPALGSPLPTPALPSTNAPDATFPPPPTPPSLSFGAVALALILAAVGSHAQEALPTDATRPVFEEWVVVVLDGKTCGYGMTTTKRVDTPSGPGFLTYHHEEFSIRRDGAIVKTTSTSRVIEDADGGVLSFEEIDDSGSPVESRGVRHGDEMVVTSRGQTERFHLPRLAALGPEAVRRATLRVPLRPGEPFSLDTFETDYPQAVVVEAGTVVDREAHDVRGRVRDLWKLDSEVSYLPGVKSITWVDDHGNDVESATTLPSIGTIHEYVADRAECMRQPEGAEIFSTSLIRPTRAVPNVRELGQAVYRLTCANLDQPLPIWNGDGQRVLESAPGRCTVEVNVVPISPAHATWRLPHADTPGLHRYLQASGYLETNDPLVESLARQAVGGESNPVLAAHKIESFVRDYIVHKDLNVAFGSAAETAKSREGDCTEHAVLCAALGRVVGLPTRCVVGFGYVPPGDAEPTIAAASGADTGLFGFHMWAEAWIGDGRWVPMDAALDGFDAGHIAVVKSALEEINPLVDLNAPVLQLMQKLRIEVVRTAGQGARSQLPPVVDSTPLSVEPSQAPPPRQSDLPPLD